MARTKKQPAVVVNYKHQLFELSEIEVSYKAKVKPSMRPVISSSSDMYQLIMQVWNEGNIEFVEEFMFVLLNRANRVLGFHPLSRGSKIGVTVDPGIIVGTASKTLATSIILFHNHPSGSLRPSRADEEMTLKVKEAAKYIDVKVLDHLIVSTEGYFSFADEGVL